MKSAKTIFICQIDEKYLKVIRCLHGYLKNKFVSVDIEEISHDDDNQISEKLTRIFKKYSYKNKHIIISLPRHLATCRYLKVPSQNPQEIERIVSLQAPRYLPYTLEELITAYQILDIDKDGYSHLNLVIAHRDVIDRYLKIFQALNPSMISIILNSYGISNLYNHIKPETSSPVMIIDININQVELVVVARKKLLFSRSFRALKSEVDWENVLVEEINKTQDVYLKEASKEAPERIVLVGAEKNLEEYSGVLSKRINLPVEVLSFSGKIALAGEVRNNILGSEASFASLIGLGLEDIAPSLSLLPLGLKEKIKSLSFKKENLRLSLLIASIILIVALGIAKNLDNKGKYLQGLKAELNKISKEARPLESLEKRFRLISAQSQNKVSGLDILEEIHKILPEGISLTNLGYTQDKEIILHGQASESNSVTLLVGNLERSRVFKKFAIRLRYATQKRMQAGEIIDFEVVCSKR